MREIKMWRAGYTSKINYRRRARHQHRRPEQPRVRALVRMAGGVDGWI